MRKVQAMSGYAYEFTGGQWNGSPDDEWDTVVLVPTGNETFLGRRQIDGADCVVFKSGLGIYAQTAQSVVVK